MNIISWLMIVLTGRSFNANKMLQSSALNASVLRKISAAVFCLFLSSFITGLSAEDKDQCGISVSGKIVGGEPVDPGDHPWMVSIHERSSKGKEFKHGCGGTIIETEWIVTAAHCVESNQNPEDYLAVLGLHKQSQKDGDEVLNVTITDIIVHEEYEKKDSKNDIALLKTEPIDFDAYQYVDKICMPEPDREPIDTAVVVGWGLTKPKGETSDILLDADVPHVPNEKCKEKYKSLTDTQICYGEENKDSCQSDSGGPLLELDDSGETATLIGIVSFGHGCGEKGWPGVYTYFAKYIDWVEEKMNE